MCLTNTELYAAAQLFYFFVLDEIARLQRIAQNNRTIAELSLRPSKRAKPKRAAPKRKRPRPVQAKIPLLPVRISKRLRGQKSSVAPIDPKEYAELLEKRRQQKEENEQRIFEEVLKRWNTSTSSTSSSSSKSSSSSSSSTSTVSTSLTDAPATLFLVPTGVEGFNDHTLSTPVCDNHYLWGFCVGLYSRIFEHVEPGDIFLFTSSGTGKFNKVGRVTEKRIVPAKEADQYWSRMEYQMGGPTRQNIGFPLLVLFAVQPVEIDWSKDEVLALCGYSDRLMSSRRIVHENNGGKNILIRKCIATLGDRTITGDGNAVTVTTSKDL